jgi:hypothetical protein
MKMTGFTMIAVLVCVVASITAGFTWTDKRPDFALSEVPSLSGSGSFKRLSKAFSIELGEEDTGSHLLVESQSNDKIGIFNGSNRPQTYALLDRSGGTEAWLENTIDPNARQSVPRASKAVTVYLKAIN